MAEPLECWRCHTFYRGLGCPRCDYNAKGRAAARRRTWVAYRPGMAQKPGDSEVRVVRAAYRDR